jgi:ubiquinone/menaquinone biosynthesis C-methylase UbiE
VTGSAEEESLRVRRAYQRRAARGLDDRYAYWEPANLFLYQSRERALAAALGEAGLLPLRGRRVLDAGCGEGAVLRSLLRFDASPDRLHGVDLLPERIRRARQALPADFHVADAQALPYAPASFDLVLGFTLLSSLLDPSARQRVAAELRRVLRPAGLILLYDFWVNPLNRHARPLSRAEVRSLFPGLRARFASVTLAPPLARAVVPLPGGRVACTILEVLPFLRTHFLAALSAA